MPVEFLSDQQVATYGRFAGPPSRSQLERCFLLNDDDLALVEQRRGDHHRLGFAVQLGTVRFLGTFLTDPLAVPSAAVEYVAAQLGIGDPACFSAYAERAKTLYEHAWEIHRAYGYRDFAEAEVELRDFLAARAATSTEGPHALFDRATAWLIERKVLLPGVTILARLIVAVRAAASERLWRLLTDGVDPALRQRLQRLLDPEEGSRYSALERLRRSPFRISGPELARALERVAEIQRLGAGAGDCSAAAPNRLATLARHGLAAKVPQFRQLTEPRRSATLLATLRQLERVATDDALDLFDVLMTTKLLARAARESAKEQLRALPRFAAASVTLAAAVQVLLATLTAEAELSWTEVWTAIEHVGGFCITPQKGALGDGIGCCGCVRASLRQVAIDRGFGDAVVVHQGRDGGPLPSACLHLGNPLARQCLAAAKPYPPCFGVLDAIALPFGADLRLKLGDRPQHVEEQPSRGGVRVDLLIQDLQVDAFALQLRSDLAQVQRGTGQPVQARHHERIAVAHILQAGRQAGALAAGAALLLRIDLVARAEFVELDREALADRTDPGVANARHGVLLRCRLRISKLL